MAAGPHDLITLELANSYLGLTSDGGGPQDTKVQALISAKSEQVQKYIGYYLKKQDYTKTFNGIFGDRYMMPDRPISNVAALSIDDQPFVKSTRGSPGFLWDEVSIYFIGLGRTTGRQNLTVTYTAGYDEIPPDIQDATLQWMNTVWINTESGIPASASRYQAGDTSITFGDVTTKASAQKSSDLMPPAIASILRPYRRVY